MHVVCACVIFWYDLIDSHTYFNFRIFEVILIAMVTTSSVFIVAMLLGTCLPDANKADIMSSNYAYVRHVYYNNTSTIRLDVTLRTQHGTRH